MIRLVCAPCASPSRHSAPTSSESSQSGARSLTSNNSWYETVNKAVSFLPAAIISLDSPQ